MPQARDEAGNIWEVDAGGNPIRLIAPGSRGGGNVISDPNAGLDAALKSNQITNANADNARADAAAARDTVQSAASLFDKGLRIGPGGQIERIPGWTPPATAEQAAQINQRKANLRALQAQLERVRQLYEAGPGKTKGFMSLKDYLPTDANGVFDTAGAGLSEQALAAFRVPGVGSQSDAELRAFVEANRPSASDRDAVIREKLRNIETRLNETLSEIEPKKDDGGPIVSFRGAGGNIGGHGAPTIPGGGQPFSTPDDVAVQDKMNSAFMAGASFDDLNKISVDAGRGPLGPEFRDAVAKRDKGATATAGTPPQSGKTSWLNDALNTAPGAAALGYLDAATGIPTAMNADAVAASREARPYSSFAGNAGGALTATTGISRLGSATLGKVAPRLLNGGRIGMFGRNLATDATYGAGYGQIANDDPLTGAALASLGSTIGQGTSATLSKALQGASLSAPVTMLREKGFPLTVGQTLGGTVKGVEDRLAGLPVIGDVVRNRQIEGLDKFNSQAFGDALSPISANVPDTKAPGLKQAYSAVSDAYDTATAGRTFPLDPTYSADLAAAQARGASLPPDLADKINLVINNRINPATANNEITGDAFQQAMRAIKGYRAENTKPGFEGDYRDVLGQIGDSLRGVVNRQGGDDVVKNLASADRAYRNVKTLDRAVTAARNGSRSGEVEMFTPSQLNDAIAYDARKFGGSTDQHPLYPLANAGQQVLPSRVPDSGTAGRLATLALPGILGGTGYGVDAMTGGDKGTSTGLVLGALLAAGGSKAAQKAIIDAIAKRPKSVTALGSQIGKRQGMFGAAATPLFIEELSQ